MSKNYAISSNNEDWDSECYDTREKLGLKF
jgi:hypothetical protein